MVSLMLGMERGYSASSSLLFGFQFGGRNILQGWDLGLFVSGAMVFLTGLFGTFIV